jgi:Tfp pilus assembly protein PilP
MKTKFLSILSIMLFIPSLVSISYAAENAFGSLPVVNNNSSQSSASYSSEPIDQSVHPLLQNEIKSNTVIGIMISPSIKTAYIRTASGDDYFVRVGDKLGNANGSITDITYEGIEVTEDSKVVSLPVRNRSTSNAIEK